MTIFLHVIGCVDHEFIDVVDFMQYLSLSIHGRFQGLLLLCFGHRFIDQPWQQFFEFHASAMTLFLLLIWCVGREFSDAIDSIRRLSLSIHWRFQGLHLLYLAGDLWISCDKAFLTIPCVSHDSIFTIVLMCRSWIQWHCQFHTAVVSQYSVMIWRSTMTLFSLPIYGSAVTLRFWQFHASAMTLFFLSIWCVVREFSDAVASIRQVSLSIHWWFQGLQLLCFRRPFMDQPWHSVFGNSMCRPSLYFCYWFDASVLNSLTLSITYVGCHSLFIEDFKVYSVFVFVANFWISSDIAFLTITWVGHDSIFAIDLMRRSSIHWHWRCQRSAVTQYSLTISRSAVTLFWPAIYGSAVT
jgi:hypothetical protein